MEIRSPWLLNHVSKSWDDPPSTACLGGLSGASSLPALTCKFIVDFGGLHLEKSEQSSDFCHYAGWFIEKIMLV